jgi:hypothetical protein
VLLHMRLLLHHRNDRLCHRLALRPAALGWYVPCSGQFLSDSNWVVAPF